MLPIGDAYANGQNSVMYVNLGIWSPAESAGHNKTHTDATVIINENYSSYEYCWLIWNLNNRFCLPIATYVCS